MLALLPPDYAEATGAAKKIKIEKANPPCPKAGKINRGETLFARIRLQPRRQYAIIIKHQKVQKKVFSMLNSEEIIAAIHGSYATGSKNGDVYSPV